MTPAEIKKTRLYRTLAPCVIRKDREELARMLAMVPDKSDFNSECPTLISTFVWDDTPQGHDYWWAFSIRLAKAGHECW